MVSPVTLPDGTQVANHLPLLLIGGVNVLEDERLVLNVALEFKSVAAELGLPFVFKASFDKANRSSITSFRGPGIDRGLKIMSSLKTELGLPIVTDIHEPWQAAAVAEVADIVQIPAFLARQTDLVVAAARTGRIVNVKKPQFLAPLEMRHILRKCSEAGNEHVLLCERGSAFGYNNLVVDMLGMDEMKALAPVVFDVTHALQCPGGRSDSADGRRAQALTLARAGVAVGIAGLFLEAHPDPDRALCDGPSALPLSKLRPFLEHIVAIDRAVKSLPELVID